MESRFFLHKCEGLGYSRCGEREFSRHKFSGQFCLEHHLDTMECNYPLLGGIDNWMFPGVAEVTLLYIAITMVTVVSSCKDHVIRTCQHNALCLHMHALF